MSPYKPSHEVRCAHCAGAGADNDCHSCRRPVCASCGLSFEGCSVPRAREIELGWGQHVLAVNSDATRAIASGFRGRRRPSVIELDHGSGAREMVPNVSRYHALKRNLIAGFNAAGEAVVVRRQGLRLGRAVVCHCGLHVTRIHSDQTVSTSWLGGPDGRRRETIRGHVIERLAYDCEVRVLIVSVRGAIHAFSCDKEHRVVRRVSTQKKEGRVVALFAGGQTVSVVTGLGARFDPEFHCVEVFGLHEAGFQAIPAIEWTAGTKQVIRARGADHAWTPAPGDKPPELCFPLSAAIRDDGAFAIALVDHRVLLLDPSSGDLSVIAKLRRAPRFLSFAERRLVAADAHGRVTVGLEDSPALR